MNNIDDLVLRETTNKYEQTRKRVTQFSRYRNCSDKEIIEYLADEIEQYRDRIKNQQRILDESIKNNIQSEGVVLDTTDDELVDEDIIEIISTTQYAEGKPIISKREYKYKENNLQKINKDLNKQLDTIKAKYEAEIFEYESGKTEISYLCDKDRNKECSKDNCLDGCCTHTLDKKYAKNFIET